MVINLDLGKMVVSIEINGSEYFSKRRWEVSLKQDDSRPVKTTATERDL
jgi:hypothetical protein